MRLELIQIIVQPARCKYHFPQPDGEYVPEERIATGEPGVTAKTFRRMIITASLCAGTLAAPQAKAIPAFAAQTGEPCSACHIGFPQLTAYGRLFKLQGYVAGGHTPTFKNLAAMIQAGYTYLGKSVPGGLAPDYPDNNAVSAQQISLFYGGALYAPIGLGAFVQGTYDDVAHQFHWDNLDIRLARPAQAFGMPLYYGFTFNNNPGVTDLWNTPPAWGYPYIADELGVGNAAGVQLSSLGQSVYGAGAYAALNITPSNMLYAEMDLYEPVPNHTAYALGVGPEVPISGVIPYWRIALQHSWGASSLEVGALGLIDNPYPAGYMHGPSDQIVDVGLDSQFQWITLNHALSLQALYVHETQHWDASYALGQASNPTDRLDEVTLTASYLYKQWLGFTESYTGITGNADPALYAPAPVAGSPNGKPNTTSFTTELDYYPWNDGGPAFFPWMNAKFFVENTYYPVFNGLAHNYDGYGRNASGNDVLFAGIWLVF